MVPEGGVRATGSVIYVRSQTSQEPQTSRETLAFKSGCVVLYTGQVQIMIPPLCVLIHTVMMALGGRRLIALPSAAKMKKKKKSKFSLGNQYCKTYRARRLGRYSGEVVT